MRKKQGSLQTESNDQERAWDYWNQTKPKRQCLPAFAHRSRNAAGRIPSMSSSPGTVPITHEHTTG
jgi:hypothetical protein